MLNKCQHVKVPQVAMYKTHHRNFCCCINVKVLDGIEQFEFLIRRQALTGSHRNTHVMRGIYYKILLNRNQCIPASVAKEIKESVKLFKCVFYVSSKYNLFSYAQHNTTQSLTSSEPSCQCGQKKAKCEIRKINMSNDSELKYLLQLHATTACNLK